MKTIIAAMFAALFLIASSAQGASCADGLEADSIGPSTQEWAPVLVGDPPTTRTYADANGTWSNPTGEALEIAGSIPACVVGDGAVFDGGLTLAKEQDTYFHLEAVHGCDQTGCTATQCLRGGICREAYAYHGSGSPAGIAPNNGFETVIEHVKIENMGDCVSAKAGSSDIAVIDSWLDRCLDDAVELDFCGESVTVENTFIDDANFAFAFDLRDGEAPCEEGRWLSVVGSHGRLRKPAHTFEEIAGHGGIFKPDNHGENPSLTYRDNVFVLGPVAGENQLQIPPLAWFNDFETQCQNVVYLWIGTAAARDDMLATAGNGENLEDLAGCVTLVTKGASESETVFLNRDLDELGGISYVDLHAAWQTELFPTQPPPPGCGIGPELALLLPLLGWLRRR